MAEFTSKNEEELVVGLYDREIIKFGDFKLKSGRKSPIYYNQRPLLSQKHDGSMSYRQQRRITAMALQGYAQKIETLFKDETDHVYGIPQAATALGALVAFRTGKSYLWGRVGKKDYGKHEGIEGFYEPGETVVQVDDVVTGADSKIESEDNLKKAELTTLGFVVMLDREEGGKETLEQYEHPPLVAVTSLSRVVPILLGNARIGNQEVESLQTYHAGLVADGHISTFSFNG